MKKSTLANNFIYYLFCGFSGAVIACIVWLFLKLMSLESALYGKLFRQISILHIILLQFVQSAEYFLEYIKKSQKQSPTSLKK